jgi:hypothetical protein
MTTSNEEYFLFLDDLRASGVTNMFGAAPYLLKAFPALKRHDARDVVLAWMKTYGTRHPANA